MKSGVMLFIFGFLVFATSFAQVNAGKTDTVSVVRDYKNLYHYQNFFLSGQPTYEMLQWLKTQDVKKIINLRTEKENSDFSSSAFNEERVASELGFEYCPLPVDGLKDYTPEKLDLLANLLNRNEKILIHCASAGRVSDFFMAYLVRKQGYSINEAIEVGKSLKFSMPLEKLLDAKINFKIAE